jgi:hypothetical protein
VAKKKEPTKGEMAQSYISHLVFGACCFSLLARYASLEAAQGALDLVIYVCCVALILKWAVQAYRHFKK